MNHTVSGRNFHGPYRLTLRGPAEGFILSERQARRYQRELCPFTECGCGGGYGKGPDSDSARIVAPVCGEGIPDHLQADLRAAERECWAPYPTRTCVLVLLPAE